MSPAELAAERIADKRGFLRGSARWLEVRACALQEIAAAEARGRTAARTELGALLDGRLVPGHGQAAYRQGAEDMQSALARALATMR